MAASVCIAPLQARSANTGKTACHFKDAPRVNFSHQNDTGDNMPVSRKANEIAAQRTLSDPSQPARTGSPTGPGGNSLLLLRQVSLPGSGPVNGELKGILKRCQSTMSDSTDSSQQAPDSDYASASPSPSFDFWYEFRSADDVFSDSSEDTANRKRVSFSEKIQRSTYRVGTCILQQKQKALKRREKRMAKDSRRTASESDASDLSAVTDAFGNLACRARDSEFAQTVDILEEVVEVDEEQTREQATVNATKRRKHGRNRKARAQSESS